MNSTALITGASKGIGKELANIFASKGVDLVLVARSENELKLLQTNLEQAYGIIVHVIVKDLSAPGSAQEVFDEVKGKGIDIDFLVNNAGFGVYGLFAETDWEVYRRMINLNAMALAEFCHLYLKDWSERKSGKILNISSTAAFQPGPMMAVYFATKVFVLYLSEAIGREAKTKGITITTLCPGPTETNFGQVSGMNASQLVKNVKIADASQVAMLGYNAIMKGQPVAIHGAMNKLVAFGVRFLPRKWVTNISARVMS